MKNFLIALIIFATCLLSTELIQNYKVEIIDTTIEGSVEDSTVTFYRKIVKCEEIHQIWKFYLPDSLYYKTDSVKNVWLKNEVLKKLIQYEEDNNISSPKDTLTF